MTDDRIDYHRNRLRGVPLTDLGRMLGEVLRDVAREAAEVERARMRSQPQQADVANDSRWIGPFTTATEALNELRMAVAAMMGADQSTWPDHGNVPLAIAAAFGIRQHAMELQSSAQPDAVEALRWDSPDWHDGTHTGEYIARLRAAIEEAEKQEPVAWAPIDTAPKARTVLVYYKNCADNGRTMRATYYSPETLESDTSDSGWADEGWYEESEAYEYLMPLQGEPTHWMPLPPPPGSAPQPARKPMTEEEIDAATGRESDALLDHIYEYGTLTEGVQQRIRAIARAIERHHGIGGPR